MGVVTALSTDEEGVSRIDLTNEFVRAARAYDLGYADMKEFARNSLSYAFLDGRRLWKEPRAAAADAACAQDVVDRH
jgi:adenosine deaminase